MEKTKIILLFSIATFVVLFCNSCSTKKNTSVNRAYHTIVSTYNVNFNAKEALKTGEKDLAKNNKENFTTLLPVYNYPAKSELGSVLPSFNRTIEKCSKSIYKHSMFIRGKEYVKTMDDCYLMMGKAYFYKQEYTQAQRIFTYIENTYKGPKWNCREEAMVLNARTAMQQKYYAKAQALLDDFQISSLNRKKSSKKINLLFFAASAEYQLTAPDGDPLAAIDFIQEALKNKPKRTFKTRLNFILGQLYEAQNQTKSAENCFKKVIKSTPPYEFEFNALMHLATNYDGSLSSKNTILKHLNKMLAEKKNEDYKDQIYYAMYKMAKIDENEELEVKNLKKSVASYSKNDFQRTLSAVTLADYYFTEEQYVEAQNYYDTALITIPNNYPNRIEIIKKGTILKDLVDNLNIISLQDSLQVIAKMTPAQRDQWVRDMIYKYTETERKAAEEEYNRMILMQSTANMANINTTQSNGKWYFYNQSLITAGKTEFFKNWGNRKNEDNWRMSNKTQLSYDQMVLKNNPNTVGADTTKYDENGNIIKERETNPKKPDYYLQDIPLTKGAIDTSNSIIANAMYNSAIIYLDLLQDPKRSCDMLEKFINRFPSDSLVPPALFLLYKNYQTLLNNNSKAEQYKNVILSKYPDTDFARLIIDPNYYKRLEEKQRKIEHEYETAYINFENKNWHKVVLLSDSALIQCTNDELKAKFEYIRAISLGQLYGEDAMKSPLANIVTNYKNSKISDLARILLSNFNDVQELLVVAGDSSTIKEIKFKDNPFKFTPNEIHYMVLLVQVSSLSVNVVKNEISDFNKNFFNLLTFSVNNFYINSAMQMITISKFNNDEEAIDYYKIIIQNKFFKENLASGVIEIFPMSSSNYTTYYNNKEKRFLYKDILKEYYLK